MVSRERLLRICADVAERATTKKVRAFAQLLLLAGVVFVGFRVRSLWHGGHIAFAGISWPALAWSVALAAVGTAAGALIWLSILDVLGVRTRKSWIGVFFQAQLGKYIPGSIWQYAGRAAVARAYRIPVRPVAISLVVEFASSAVAAGSLAAFLLGWWGGFVVAGIGGLLLVVDRLALDRRSVAFATAHATLFFLPVWALLGASFWLCARALVTVPSRDLPFYAGAFSVAWLAGLFAVYAPGGLGVREAVLVALLSARIGAADALVVAVASRAITTFIDVVLAAVGFVLLRSGKRKDPHSENPRAGLAPETSGPRSP